MLLLLLLLPADQPKWDTWGRLFEPLLAHVPLIHVNTNHEIEQQPSGKRDVSYNHRYPTPQLTGFDYTKGGPSLRMRCPFCWVAHTCPSMACPAESSHYPFVGLG